LLVADLNRGASIVTPSARTSVTQELPTDFEQIPAAEFRASALSVLIESEPKLQILFLAHFLHANRYPLRSKTLWF